MNNVRHFSVFLEHYPLPTLSDNSYPINSNFGGHFGPLYLPTLKSEVIYGRSLVKKCFRHVPQLSQKYL